MRDGGRRTSGLARRYARALLDVATQRDAQDGVGSELAVLATLFREDPVLRRTLTDPLVPQKRREEVLTALVEAAQLREETAETLRQMLAHDRMARVPEVEVAYGRLLDERRGIVEVDVETAAPLDDAQREHLRRALERLTGHEVRLEEEVDPDLLGGVVARVGDVVYDASVKGRLRQIREEMAAGSE